MRIRKNDKCNNEGKKIKTRQRKEETISQNCMWRWQQLSIIAGIAVRHTHHSSDWHGWKYRSWAGQHLASVVRSRCVAVSPRLCACTPGPGDLGHPWGLNPRPRRCWIPRFWTCLTGSLSRAMQGCDLWKARNSILWLSHLAAGNMSRCCHPPPPPPPPTDVPRFWFLNNL